MVKGFRCGTASMGGITPNTTLLNFRLLVKRKCTRYYIGVIARLATAASKDKVSNRAGLKYRESKIVYSTKTFTPQRQSFGMKRNFVVPLKHQIPSSRFIGRPDTGPHNFLLTNTIANKPLEPPPRGLEAVAMMAPLRATQPRPAFLVFLKSSHLHRTPLSTLF